jgi:hypothetical protein
MQFGLALRAGCFAVLFDCGKTVCDYGVCFVFRVGFPIGWALHMSSGKWIIPSIVTRDVCG